jgi:hypothetical protein
MGRQEMDRVVAEARVAAHAQKDADLHRVDEPWHVARQFRNWVSRWSTIVLSPIGINTAQIGHRGPDRAHRPRSSARASPNTTDTAAQKPPTTSVA